MGRRRWRPCMYRFGVGQAEALILFVIVACISGIQVYLTKKKEVEA